MQPIAETELILNKRGAIYHLNLKPEEIASTIITVGDPGRVKEVSKYFDSIEHRSEYREFITHTGFIGDKRLSVISSGIGTDNIDIMMNELDALVNIDLESRTVKSKLSSLNIIRLGTSGSIQVDVPVDSFVVGTHGLGLDNLMVYYKSENTIEENEIINSFFEQVLKPSDGTKAYVNKGSENLLRYFKKGFQQGITVSCPGFYGPQGRVLRIQPAFPMLVEKLASFRSKDHLILNFEMESSALYGLGKYMGHQCISLNAIIANRASKEFSKDIGKTVERLIEGALGVIVGIAR